MAKLKTSKLVSTLPATLAADTIYLVRTGDGFDLYCSDATGSVAHKVNGGGPETPDGGADGDVLTWDEGLREWGPKQPSEKTAAFVFVQPADGSNESGGKGAWAGVGTFGVPTGGSFKVFGGKFSNDSNGVTKTIATQDIPIGDERLDGALKYKFSTLMARHNAPGTDLGGEVTHISSRFTVSQHRSDGSIISTGSITRTALQLPLVSDGVGSWFKAEVENYINEECAYIRLTCSLIISAGHRDNVEHTFSNFKGTIYSSNMDFFEEWVEASVDATGLLNRSHTHGDVLSFDEIQDKWVPGPLFESGHPGDVLGWDAAAQKWAPQMGGSTLSIASEVNIPVKSPGGASDSVASDWVSTTGTLKIQTGGAGAPYSLYSSDAITRAHQDIDISDIADTLYELTFSWFQASFEGKDKGGHAIYLLDDQDNILYGSEHPITAAPIYVHQSHFSTWQKRDLTIPMVEGAKKVRLALRGDRVAGNDNNWHTAGIRLIGKLRIDLGDISNLGTGTLVSSEIGVEKLTEYRHPVNGKPLYSYTINWGKAPNNARVEKPLASLGMPMVEGIDRDGILFDLSRSFLRQTSSGAILPAVWVNPQSLGASVTVYYLGDSDSIVVWTAANRASFDAYFSILYTRNTDTNNSPVALIGSPPPKTGEIMNTVGGIPANGWVGTGATYAQAAYPELFALLGLLPDDGVNTSYNTDTHFYVPHFGPDMSPAAQFIKA